MVRMGKVEMPLRVSIIHHSFEKMSKSSIAPMRLLTNGINVYPFSNHEEENEKEVFDRLPADRASTFILYPHPKSKTLSQVTRPIKDLIILDCTWFQTDQILT